MYAGRSFIIPLYLACHRIEPVARYDTLHILGHITQAGGRVGGFIGGLVVVLADTAQ